MYWVRADRHSINRALCVLSTESQPAALTSKGGSCFPGLYAVVVHIDHGRSLRIPCIVRGGLQAAVQGLLRGLQRKVCSQDSRSTAPGPCHAMLNGRADCCIALRPAHQMWRVLDVACQILHPAANCVILYGFHLDAFMQPIRARCLAVLMAFALSVRHICNDNST